MKTYASTHFWDLLEQTSLLPLVLAVKHGVPSSIVNSLGMLEQYDSETCTFFTLIGEMVISPWEMQWVLGLPTGIRKECATLCRAPVVKRTEFRAVFYLLGGFIP